MNVVLIKNKEEFEDKLAEYSINDTIFVWDGKEPLDIVLEEISPFISKKDKIRLKVCNNVKLKNGATVIYMEDNNTKNFYANDLYEILSQTKLNKGITVVVESNEISEVISLFQEFINLGIIADILTREEIKKKKAVQLFQNLNSQLEKLVSNIIEYLKNQPYKVHIEPTKNDLLKSLKNIKINLEKSFDDVIKVAVFATKKAGKSMVVNALLREELAPTSLELPTPNVVIYKPHKENYYILDYKGKKTKYENREDLKKFIEEEFNRVKLTGEKLPIMTIYYPRKPGINFEIYDTPGPDLAKSEHADFIDEYIEKADVSVFVVDYTKYAQTSEVELLKKIKDAFDKYNKKYSFICLVNKIDTMYHDEGIEKIRTRVSKFMENKLKTLGFKDFVIIPVTAMIYFYLETLKDIVDKLSKEEDLSKLDEVENINDYLNDIYDYLEDLDISDEILSTVENMANYIRRIHKIKNPTYDDIKNVSGFDLFIRYLKYIVNEKAKLEKYMRIIEDINIDKANLNNILNNRFLLKKDAQKIKEGLEKYLSNLNKEERLREIQALFENLKKDIDEFKDKAPAELINELESSIHIIVEEAIEKLKKQIEEDLNYIASHPLEKDEILASYKNKVILKKEEIKNIIVEIILKSLEQLDDKLVKYKEDYKDKFKNLKIKLIKATEELLEFLEKNFPEEKGKIESFKVPELDIEMSFENIRDKIEEFSENSLRNINISMEDIDLDACLEGGLLRWLGYLFFNIKPYDVNKGKLEQEIKELKNRAFEAIKEAKIGDTLYRNFHPSLVDICNNIKNVLNIYEEKTKKYVDSLYKPAIRIMENLSLEKKEKDEIVDFLEGVNNKREYKEFDAHWKNIVNILKSKHT